MICDEIRYVADNGFRGALYDYHECDGRYYYQMSIRDKEGHEILHAYNARPKTYEQLKEVVDEHTSMIVNFLAHIK